MGRPQGRAPEVRSAKRHHCVHQTVIAQLNSAVISSRYIVPKNLTKSNIFTMHSIEGETINPQLVQIPDYDEDLEEAYIGPFSEELDEAYDDAYEAESTAMIEGSDPPALTSSCGVVSDNTQA